MRRKFFKIILIIFGLLGFLLINDAIYRLENNESYGFIVALVGAGFFLLLAIGMFLYNRLQLPAAMPGRERKRRQRLGLSI